MMYHFLTVSVVSTSGAQMNFRIFGNKTIATRGATCSNGIPALVNKKSYCNTDISAQNAKW
jgi:DUF4097 and DUF4098 domain-containing protein YvlB